MGSFGGHALPGSFLLFYGLWWAFSAFNRYFTCKGRSARFVSTVAYPCLCLCGRLKHWPIEPCVKIVFVVVGFSLEIITAYDESGQFVSMGNAQHATMFFYFGVSGVVDLLVHFKAPIPPNADYVIMAASLMVEGLLFKFHLHGRTELDVLVHTLLLYAIYCNIVAVLLEMQYRHHILSPVARAYFFCLQGTWFWQVGYILYNPLAGAVPWLEDDHDQKILITVMFAWHAMALFILVLLMGVVIHCFHRRYGYGALDDDDISLKRLIHTGANGQTVVRLHEDSESDLEFEQQPVNGGPH